MCIIARCGFDHAIAPQRSPANSSCVTYSFSEKPDITPIASPQKTMPVQSTSASSTAIALNTSSRPFEKLLTGVALTCALSLAMQGFAQSSEVPAHPSAANITLSARAVSASMPNGTYLYGQAPKAGQLGATYLVFEVNHGNVTGAFYMPRSSFDCVHGTLQTQQLALTVVNSYEQASYPYTVALQSGGTSAATRPEVAPVGLEGYYRIKQLSAGDRRILSTCKTQKSL